MAVLGIVIFVLGGLMGIMALVSLGLFAALSAVVIALAVLIFQLPQPYSYIVFCIYMFCVLGIAYKLVTKE